MCHENRMLGLVFAHPVHTLLMEVEVGGINTKSHFEAWTLRWFKPKGFVKHPSPQCLVQNPGPRPVLQTILPAMGFLSGK